ncbi:MAG: hypothetical protein P8186_14360, partial [Anaerolineae bacterium]
MPPSARDRRDCARELCYLLVTLAGRAAQEPENKGQPHATDQARTEEEDLRREPQGAGGGQGGH